MTKILNHDVLHHAPGAPHTYGAWDISSVCARLQLLIHRVSNGSVSESNAIGIHLLSNARDQSKIFQHGLGQIRDVDTTSELSNGVSKAGIRRAARSPDEDAKGHVRRCPTTLASYRRRRYSQPTR